MFISQIFMGFIHFQKRLEKSASRATPVQAHPLAFAILQARHLALLIMAAAILFTVPSASDAQISTGAINGTVSDSSGAVIPGADVILTNTGTGIKRSTRTTDTGTYSLTEVQPGTYNLSIQKQRFSVANLDGIKIAVSQAVTMNEILKAGSVTQTVDVTATTATINLSTAANGTAITAQQVAALPLNGRNFTQLLTLTPGAVAVNVDQNASNSPNSFLGTRIGTVVFPAINGQGNRSNLFSVDGLIDQGVMGANYAVAPIPDDIEEFKVSSLNDEAMFGGVTGGVINVVTKGGTNDFHGVAWEFLRNSALDARNPFLAQVTALHQNQFGANLGGPVLLPRYNGRTKTFFFIGYEQFHQTLGGENLYSVPTASELAGDLSDQPHQIYNPFSTRPDPNHPGSYIRDPFPNNQIPSGLIDKNMIAYAQLFPQPVSTGVSGFNGLDTTPTTTNQYQGNGRVDEQINQNNSMWFRYSRYNLPIQAAGGYKGLIEPIDDYGWNYGASYLHIFNPTTILQVQFGRTYDNAISGSAFANRPSNIISSTGFASSFACGFAHGNGGCLVPNVSIPGFLAGGESYNADGQSDFYQYSANFTKTVRSQTLKSGFALYPTRFDAVKEYDTLGFNIPQTANPESPGNTGNALASFLLGVPDNATYRNSSEAERGGKIMGAYLGDQWKVTPSLTINAGIRYDITFLPPFGLASDKSDYVGNLDLNNGTYVLQANPGPCTTNVKAPCIPGGLPQPNISVSSNGKIFQNSTDNIQPRVGIAYAVNGNTVVHAGFGVYFDNWANFQQLNQNVAGTWPQVQLVLNTNLNYNIVNVTAENPVPGGGGLPPATPFVNGASYADPNFKNTKSDQWIVGLERQLSSNTTITANYVGNKNSRLWLRETGNTALTPGPGPVAPRTPYPYIQSGHNYDTSLGSGNYNALQVALNRSPSNGFSYLVAYTWSKSIDVGCSDRENCSVQDPYHLNTSRSVSSFDLPQVLSASVVYQLPFGANRHFRLPNAVLNQIVGNWQLNTILTLHSGLPYTLVTAGDIANTGNSGNYERLDVTGDLSLPNRSKAEWFNTAAVAVPHQYTFGDLGRNSLRSDWFRNDDLSLFRSFPIRGEKSVEFRVEAFNFTNTPTLASPGNNISIAHFGQVTQTYSTQREVQFALKIHY
ncbi:carboxypeptidase-like regulatory domain-containing protein [Edaphobacter paludis]|uniref:Carboxypeptidase-like regulatory domain-containing protein n=1 Tax=Edaphobacter paludis TaxID=3035702 RepID=A0AAU7D5T9_9BACT